MSKKGGQIGNKKGGGETVGKKKFDEQSKGEE